MLKRIFLAFLLPALAFGQYDTRYATGPQMNGMIGGVVNFLSSLRASISHTANHSTPHMVQYGTYLLVVLTLRNLWILSSKTLGQSFTSPHQSALFLPTTFLLLVRFSLASMFLLYYLHPLPVGGMTFPEVIPSIANALGSSIQLDLAKEVLAQFNAAIHINPSFNPINLFLNMSWLEMMVVLIVAQFAMTIITSTSFLFLGALTFIGPLCIAFFVDFKWDNMFWSWIGDSVVYSMQEVFANIFVAIFAKIYADFFCQTMHSCDAWHPTFTFGSLVGQLFYLFLITLTFAYVMFQVPSFTSARFQGFGRLGQDFSNSLQRALVTAIFA